MFGPDYFFANAHGMSEGHDSTIHFVSDVGPTPRAHSLSLRHLPLRDVGQLFPNFLHISYKLSIYVLPYLPLLRSD